MHNRGTNLCLAALAAAATALSGAPPAVALTATANVNVNVEIAPIAYLVFLNTPLLYLEIPPPGSTAPSNGVFFKVIGNASATLVAEPDAFIDVPVEGFMGKAVLGASAVGYKLDLRFPRTGSAGPPPSPIQVAALPGFVAGPTTPPLTVNLLATGGQREGVINMETNQLWTADGSMPLAGLHVGQVILTLSADY
jgi:hypothetical protein